MEKNPILQAFGHLMTFMLRIRMSDQTCTILKNDLHSYLPGSGVCSTKELLEAAVKDLAYRDDRRRFSEFLLNKDLDIRFADTSLYEDEFRLQSIGWARFFAMPVRDPETGKLEEVLLCIRDVNDDKERAIKAQRNLEKSNDILKEALAVARNANQAKTVFLNSMSHDIRTPMNAIIGFAALARAHADNKEQVVDYLDKIAISSNHLLSLINDVLDMSRIESGRTTLDIQEVSLPKVLHDTRAIIHSNMQAKQIEFFVDCQDVIHENVKVDKLRLNQVLLNILGNAVKFTPAGGKVSLRVIENPCDIEGYAEYEFHIKDTGIGMSPEYQKHIFEPFSREHTSTVSGIQGSGLGMAITKNIVDIMKGAIAVNSEVGQGTEFTVIFNLEQAGEAVSQEVIPELEDVHVLVADDDYDTCSSVSKMLSTIGMRPEWTTSGKEAVLRTQYATDQGDAFGAFIIDWLMPDMNGIEVVRRIRKSIGASTPIIILTAYDWSNIEEEAREAGVTGFCSKPLFLSELREALSRPLMKKEEVAPIEEAKPDLSVLQGCRILLADDNLLNQELAEAILTEYGFELDIVGDGTEALELMIEHSSDYYDALITDIQMPLMDGYELSRRIRSLDDPKKANIPVIALTANAFEDDRRRAEAAQMSGFISKPIDIGELQRTLLQLLEKKGRE